MHACAAGVKFLCPPRVECSPTAQHNMFLSLAVSCLSSIRTAQRSDICHNDSFAAADFVQSIIYHAFGVRKPLSFTVAVETEISSLQLFGGSHSLQPYCSFRGAKNNGGSRGLWGS